MESELLIKSHACKLIARALAAFFRTKLIHKLFSFVNDWRGGQREASDANKAELKL